MPIWLQTVLSSTVPVSVIGGLVVRYIRSDQQRADDIAALKRHDERNSETITQLSSKLADSFVKLTELFARLDGKVDVLLQQRK